MQESLLVPREYKLTIARNFSRVANTYDQASILQREVGSRLLERLELIRFYPSIILDLGSGTGFTSKVLSQKYPDAIVLNADIAEDMLKFARSNHTSSNQCYLCGDGDYLPIKTHSVDFVFSNCALHWFFMPQMVFKEIHRILKPEGLLLFSTFGPDTLKELRDCLATLGSEERFNPFIDMHNVGDMLLQEKLFDPVMDMEKITFTYKNIMELIRDLKLTGSHYVDISDAKFKRSLTRNSFGQLLKCYEKYQDKEQRFPATFEIIYGHAWSGKTYSLHRQAIPLTIEEN